MRIKNMKEVIPVALAELRDIGHDEVSAGDLCRQVANHDPKHLKRREILKTLFNRFGIEPRPPTFPCMMALIQIPLTELERDGVIEGNFEEREDDRPRRRKYKLTVSQSDKEI